MRAIFSPLTAISILGIYLEEYLAKKYNFIIDILCHMVYNSLYYAAGYFHCTEGIFEMKIKIGPYREWFGPYQLASALCFWMKKTPGEQWLHKEKSCWVDNFGEWLSYGSVSAKPVVGETYSQERDRPTTLLSNFLSWVSSKQKRKIKVHIDRWDTWNMDDTLAHIILPMLNQLKKENHGAAAVDADDCPKHLSFFESWEWVMDEMIFAFESKLDDEWKDQFYTGQIDHKWKQLENGMSEMIKSPDGTYKCDHEGMKAYQARISNGFRLFGKYYESLWD